MGMKPGHVITDNPSLFEDAIETAVVAGLPMTAGPIAPSSAKYVFRKALPSTLFFDLAREVQKRDCRTMLALNGTMVENVRKTTPVAPSPVSVKAKAKAVTVLPVPFNPQPLKNTAVICVFYGTDPMRWAAVVSGLRQLLRLDPMPLIVLVEAAVRDKEMFKALAKGEKHIKYVHVSQQDKWNGDLFQKEALFNIGAAHCVDCDVLIFHDPDSWPIRETWAAEVKSKIESKPDAAIQCYSAMFDTGDLNRPNFSIAYKRSVNEKVFGNPGLSWAMLRKTFEALGGFNPWCICGAGDAMFVSEAFPDVGYRPDVYSLPCYTAIRRQVIPLKDLMLLDCKMMHANHGPFQATTDGREGRGYRWRWRIISHYGENAIKDHVRLKAGLLAWKDPDCELRQAIKRKGECNNIEDVERVLADAERGIVTVTRKRFTQAHAKDPKYYKPDRWNRLDEACTVLRQMPVECFAGGVLEIGPYLCPLIHPCDTLDIDVTKSPTYVHDAGACPWPIKDRKYSLAIASHCLEHLEGRQAAAIREMARVADWLFIALPYKWKDQTLPSHVGINRDTLAGWIAAAGVNLVRYGSSVTCEGEYRQLVDVYRAFCS